MSNFKAQMPNLMPKADQHLAENPNFKINNLALSHLILN